MEKTVQSVYYAFDASALTLPLVERHAAYARDALSNTFKLSTDSVKIAPRKRASPEQPFQLTCYVGRSETDVSAMAVAAKAVLPHYREMCQLARQTCQAVEGWRLGKDEERDRRVLEGVVSGQVVGLQPAQRAALVSTTAERLHIKPEDAPLITGTMTDEQLAGALLWLMKHRPRTRQVLLRA
ncbi:hypothetical protein IS481_14735 [Caldimonas thermodepolymerans]|nr:hypothetical protein [Caldimonas thermodepolymerans]QPC30979.1 hypothetical protein IS481_14735 [Caldimonas thermodepolymerans]RDH97007.1 hypothetical protein DES46_10923 [Caldimonas thermodepolymerans]